MLESLVSSKIRRALLEHLVTHPSERFYLRGLAKELQVTVSPLRRELKRLEKAGVLSAYDEANIRFYVVNQQAPLFLQLTQTFSSPQASAAAVIHSEVPARAASPIGPGQSVGPEYAEPARSSQAVASTRPRVFLSQALLLPTSVATFLVMVALLIVIAQTAQHGRQLGSSETRIRTEPAVAVHTTSTMEMRSARWRLVPGMAGGFGSGTESHSQ